MSADLPTPNTETRHMAGPMRVTSDHYAAIAERPALPGDPEFPRAYADWGDHFAAVVVYGRDVETADSRRYRVIASVNACDSMPDPQEGIRKAIEAIEWLIDDMENNCDEIELLRDDTIEGSWYHRLKDALSALKGESKA